MMVGRWMTRGLDPLSGLPVYRQIADTLRRRIESGSLGVGDRLPSENELIEEFGAARQTVRQAVGLLKSEGLVHAERGKGAFVRGRPPVRRLAFDRFARRHRKGGKGAYSVEMEGRQPSVQVLHVGPEKASTEVAGWLRMRPGAKVLRRSRRYLAAGEPMELATSYIPWTLAAGTRMTDEDTGPGGIYARIEETGHELSHFTEEVQARMPTPDEARALALPIGTPVFRLTRIAYDVDDLPVEACDTIMAADRYVLTYQLPAD
jgi:GntR family transcriptional regulator